MTRNGFHKFHLIPRFSLTLSVFCSDISFKIVPCKSILLSLSVVRVKIGKKMMAWPTDSYRECRKERYRNVFPSIPSAQDLSHRPLVVLREEDVFCRQLVSTLLCVFLIFLYKIIWGVNKSCKTHLFQIWCCDVLWRSDYKSPERFLTPLRSQDAKHCLYHSGEGQGLSFPFQFIEGPTVVGNVLSIPLHTPLPESGSK